MSLLLESQKDAKRKQEFIEQMNESGGRALLYAASKGQPCREETWGVRTGLSACGDTYSLTHPYILYI